MSPVASSRWCPTPEQVMILEEMYRSGIRSPNASQIQQITTHLSFYGKIEGKNVFYWFQNHKARDRQKLRKRLSKQLMHQHQHHHHHQPQQVLVNHHNHLFQYLQPPPAYSSPLLQLPHYNSTHEFPPQDGVLQGASNQMINQTWKEDQRERLEMDKSTARTYGLDWMMMMDVGPSNPCCNRPLKTLELFPITATSLKDECTTSN